jgi:hypothetical protein
VLLALASVVAVGAVTLAGPQLTMAFTQVTAAIGDPMGLLAAPAPTTTPQTAETSSTAVDSAAPTPSPIPLSPLIQPRTTPASSPMAQPTPVPSAPEHDEGRHRGQGPQN